LDYYINVNGIRIINYGGDIYNLKYKELDSVGLDSGFLPKNGFVPRNSNLEFSFENLFLNTNKTKLVIQFSFTDGLYNIYNQNLVLIENPLGTEFQLGKMLSLSK
jgi:hypothetical protein